MQGGQVGFVESDRSLQLKLEVARAAHVAGVALWVRGGESAGVWREPLLDAAYVALRISAGGSSSSSPARTSSPHSRQRQAVGGTRPPQPTCAAR